MKLFALIFLAAVTTKAQNIEDIGFSQITKGKYTVSTPAPKCPPNALCMPVTILDLSLNLEGCVDKAIVSYNVVKNKTGKLKVVISAVNVKNPASAVTRCIAQPTSQHKIFLGAGFITKDSVEVEFLGQMLK